MSDVAEEVQFDMPSIRMMGVTLVECDIKTREHFIICIFSAVFQS